jgi:hypothetical protein
MAINTTSVVTNIIKNKYMFRLHMLSLGYTNISSEMLLLNCHLFVLY